MSMMRCDECGRLIDTDFDVEAYIEHLDKWLCSVCREDQEKDDD